MEWNDPYFFPGSRSVRCHLRHHECHNRMSESVSNTLDKAQWSNKGSSKMRLAMATQRRTESEKQHR